MNFVSNFFCCFFLCTVLSAEGGSVYENYEMTEEDIQAEIELGDKELLAQLIQAEAGNQDLEGMQLVADVVLNRVADPRFPDTIEEVIFQTNPTQFSVTKNGMFEEAGWNISEDAYLAVELEWEEQLNTGILYFSSTRRPVNGKNAFKHGDHWFSY